MNVKGRAVAMFRCHIDPMIGKTPRNAFVPKDLGMSAILADLGVVVKVHATGIEHLVPFANVQSVRLDPVVGQHITPDEETAPPPKRIGRPPKLQPSDVV